MKVTFISLVIKVSTINQKYGTVKDFVRKHKIHCSTNGKLLIMSEMISPGLFLMDFADSILNPLGFKSREDYLLISIPAEPTWQQIHPLVHCGAPECEGINWLGSTMGLHEYYVWIKE